MKKHSLLAASLVLSLAVSTFAQGQGAGQGSGSTTTVSPQIQTAPPVQTASPNGAFCSLGEALGVNIDEATVAARYLCGEVWNATEGKPAATYRVHIGKLGAKILVTLEAEAQGLRNERHIEVAALDELPIAAPRIASALVHNTSLKDTETADNVLRNEERTASQKRGAIKLEGGIVGTTLVGPPLVAPAAGLNLQLDYMHERAVIYAGFRFGLGPEMQTVGVHAGADYHLSDGDIAPFVGGGAAWSAMKIEPDQREIAGSGFGVYAEAGVTAFRTNRTNFRVGLRVDVPFFAQQEESFRVTGTSASGFPTYEASSSNVYAVPVSLTVGVALF